MRSNVRSKRLKGLIVGVISPISLIDPATGDLSAMASLENTC